MSRVDSQPDSLHTIVFLFSTTMSEQEVHLSITQCLWGPLPTAGIETMVMMSLLVRTITNGQSGDN